MCKARFLVVVAVMAILSGSLLVRAGAIAPGEESLAGAWEGKLNVSGAEVSLIVRITRNTDGTYAARLDVPIQGAMDIPVSKITSRDGMVRLEIAAIGGVFEGRLSADGREITGEWRQNGLVLPLLLRRTDQTPVLRRPQEPAKPYPYREEEVTFENRPAGINLAGTLTLPKSAGPFPAVILISGSGAQDRDEALAGHRPFLVLADYLTRQGVAVLRVDDRGVGGSAGDSLRATSSDFADDALAGVAYLKGRREIDTARIGLIGHSEGGLVAPLAATRSQDVAFIVLLAGPGLPGEQIIYLQTDLILRANGATAEQAARERELQRSIFAVVKEENDPAPAAKRLREILAAYLDRLSPEEKAELNEDAFIEGQIRAALSPWFRYFLTYDPRPALQRVSCPVLAINGEKDLQVPGRENLAAIEEALKAGRSKDFTVRSLPNLNHLFQTCITGSPVEYGTIEETISPLALQTIGDWLALRVAR